MATGARISDPAGADQAIAPTTVTPVTFDTVDFDSNGFADLGTFNTRLTVPTGFDGLYLIGASVMFSTALSLFCYAGLRKDGGSAIIYQSTEVSSSQNVQNSVAYLDVLTAGQYYEVVVFTENPDVTHSARGPYLWMTRLGPAP